MRIAMIGLGSFAEKAYLPVLATRPGLQLHLHTRNQERLAELAARYRAAATHPDLDSLIAAQPRAAFVHAATEAHVPIVRTLLNAGIDVYVDKPLASAYADARDLVELAESRGRSLMVGFNRRYAPFYAALRDVPRQLLVMRKNRPGLPDDVREAIFGDFIHVVDTLRFLAPGPVRSTEIQTTVHDGRLELAVVHLIGRDFSAIGTMHRVAAGVEEELECVGPGRRCVVTGLTETHTTTGTEQHLARHGVWTAPSWQRGIDQICDEFLGAVATGRVLSAHDALATHELCEQIVGHAGSGGWGASGVSGAPGVLCVAVTDVTEPEGSRDAGC